MLVNPACTSPMDSHTGLLPGKRAGDRFDGLDGVGWDADTNAICNIRQRMYDDGTTLCTPCREVERLLLDRIGTTDGTAHPGLEPTVPRTLYDAAGSESLNSLPRWEVARFRELERWFVRECGSEGVCCSSSASNDMRTRSTCKRQPCRCRACRRAFCVKTDTVMHGSNLGCRIRVLAIHRLTSRPKGVSSLPGTVRPHPACASRRLGRVLRVSDRGRCRRRPLRGPDGLWQGLKRRRERLYGECPGRPATSLNEIETVPTGKILLTNC